MEHVLTLLSYTTKVSMISWRVVHLTSLIYLTSPFSLKCLPPTHSHSVCGRYPPAAVTDFMRDLHNVQ